MSLNTYEVSFDMEISKCYVVNAKNESEAKHIAFAMFEKLRNQKSSYDIDVYKR